MLHLRNLKTYIVGWFCTAGRFVGIICNWGMNVQFLIKCVHYFFACRARRVLVAWRTPSSLVNLITFETSSEFETELADIFGNRVVWIHETFHTNSNWYPLYVKDTTTIMFHIYCTAVLLKKEGNILRIGTKFSVFCQVGLCRGLLRPLKRLPLKALRLVKDGLYLFLTFRLYENYCCNRLS